MAQEQRFSGQRILGNGLTHTEGLFYKFCIIFPAIITSLLLFLTDIEDVVPEKYGGTVAMLTTMLTTISAFFVKFNIGQRRDNNIPVTTRNNYPATLDVPVIPKVSPRSNTQTPTIPNLTPIANPIDAIVNQLKVL